MRLKEGIVEWWDGLNTSQKIMFCVNNYLSTRLVNFKFDELTIGIKAYINFIYDEDNTK